VTSLEFDAIHKRLSDELVLLHDAWDQYQFLFGASEERVRMLNVCASWFFSLNQRVLLRETVLGISRLTDAQTTGQYDNLVLASLLLDPALDALPAVKADLNAAIENAVAAAGTVRVHRNKSIAHLDYATAIGAEPLPGVSRRSISEVIEKMESAYKIHGQRVRKTDTDFVVYSLSSARALVEILEQSDRWKRYQKLHPPSA
jgi:hypothetical protein